MGECCRAVLEAMLPKAMKAMKAMKAEAMKARKEGAVLTKSGLFQAVGAQTGLKSKDVKGVMDSLGGVVAGELKKNGTFTLKGAIRLKLKHKAARPAGTRMMFGKLT